MRWTPPPRAVINILLAGVLLRWLNLDAHSLWLDEGVTWSWARLPTWKETLLPEANHPPLWWLLTRAWIGLFGDSESSLRAPSVICGVLTVFLAWRVALRLLDPTRAPKRGGFPQHADGGAGARTAMWFAGFVACGAYFLEISQEARGYAGLLPECLGLVLLYFRWLDRHDKQTLVLYGALAVVSLHTHYFSVWPLLGLPLHALWLARRNAREPDPALHVRPWPLVLTSAVAALLFVPWLVFLLTTFRALPPSSPYNPFERILGLVWGFGAGPGLISIDAERIAEGQAAVLRQEWPTAVLVSLAWFPALLLGTWRIARRPRVGSLFVCLVLLPLLALFAMFPWARLIHGRYLVFLAPWLWFLAVFGACFARGLLRVGLLAGLVLLTAVGVLTFHGVDPGLVGAGKGGTLDGVGTFAEFVPNPADATTPLHHGHPYGKEPWREVRTFVKDYGHHGDLVVLYPDYIHLVWDYYARDLPWRLGEPVGLEAALPSPEEILARHGARFAAAKRIFLIVSHAETDDPDEAFRRVKQAVGAAWDQDGTDRKEFAGPIPFRRSWGVRVSVFARK